MLSFSEQLSISWAISQPNGNECLMPNSDSNAQEHDLLVERPGIHPQPT